MFFNATNGNIIIENGNMDFISFGKGEKVLIMIPGLSDGLKTVKGMANVMARMYKCFAKSHRVYILSRKNNMDKGYSTRDMAADYKVALEKLGVLKADVLGVSQGGMIAQYLAIDYPDLVEKLVLAVTLSKQNETVESIISSWIKMAEKDDYRSLFIDIAEKSYTEKRLRKYRPLYPLLSKIGKPKCFNRFIIQANACMTHNAYDELDKINCPTLVIGGDSDKITGSGTSEEIAGKIKNSKLIIYHGFGHSVYDEVKDLNQTVLKFLNTIGGY